LLGSSTRQPGHPAIWRTSFLTSFAMVVLSLTTSTVALNY
jgi:hypothetical protein